MNRPPNADWPPPTDPGGGGGSRLPEPQGQDESAILHVTEQTRTYPCLSCGGELAFDAEVQAMKCPNCGNVVPISPDVARPGRVGKKDLDSAMRQLAQLQAAAQTHFSGDKEVVCQNCGGRTLFSGTLTATRCPYCNTPIQRDDVQAAPTRLPMDGILPLQISQKDAQARIEEWINSRRFAPNAFKKYRTLGSFTSVYLPYFSYDAATTTDYTGMRGVYRTVYERDSEGRTVTRTVTDWYPAAGTVRNQFEDVTGHASRGLDDEKVTELEPWPMNYSHQYSPQFVAGHLARTYDWDAMETFNLRAGPRMAAVIDSTIMSDIGGNVQQIHSRNTTWLMLRFAQLALPVWMLTVTFKNQPFQVAINGVTGEVQGRRPWSWIKITLLVLFIAAVLAGAYYLYTVYGEQA